MQPIYAKPEKAKHSKSFHHVKAKPPLAFKINDTKALMGGKNGAIFGTFYNNTAMDITINKISLVAESNPYCRKIELHDHILKDGVMQMVQIPEIVIPANGKIELKSGSKHIMLMGLHQNCCAPRAAFMKVEGTSNCKPFSKKIRLPNLSKTLRCKNYIYSGNDVIWKPNNTGPRELTVKIAQAAGLKEFTKQITLKEAALISEDAWLKRINKKTGKKIERWETKDFLSDTQEKDVKKRVEKSPLWKEILPPKESTYDYLIILGCTAPGMLKRMQFAEKISSKRKVNIRTAIYVLGSERNLAKGSEAEKEVLKELQKKKIKTTEYEAAKHLWESNKIKLKSNPKLAPIFVNTLNKENGDRATTEDTLLELKKLLPKSVKGKTFLIISSNPYISYQDTIAKKVLLPMGCDVFTVGSTALKSTNMKNVLDSIALTLKFMNESSDLYLLEKTSEKADKPSKGCGCGK